MAICCGALEIVDARPRLIDHHQRVHPDIAFGVPLGFLRAVDQRLHFREQAIDHAELERERETDRRARRQQQQLFDFTPDAFRRQIVERDVAAQILCCGIHLQSESRRELDAAQHPQAVLDECSWIDRAQDPALDRSTRPSNGSRYSPVSGSQEIALTVKSRRRAASAGGIEGSPSTSNARWPRPVFDSRRGSDTSTPATL